MSSLNDRVNIGVAAVVIDDDGRFLLAERLADKHGKGTWSFPGGKPDPGESPEQACLRELAEETGIIADFAQPLGVWTYDRWDSEQIHYVTLYFLVDGDGQVPQDLEPEKQGPWEWLTPDECFEQVKPRFPGIDRVMELLY